VGFQDISVCDFEIFSLPNLGKDERWFLVWKYCSICLLVYGLVLLLLQSNCAVSKILVEETGQCRYIFIQCSFRLFCCVKSLSFYVNSRQMGLSNNNKPVWKRSTSVLTVATMKDSVDELNVTIGRY
jgi:hypothetical protein